MNDTGAGRRVRGGGGATRRAERTAVSFETAKFIERNIPNFEILNEEALQIIEWNAETVLEEIGVNFVENPAALQRWRDAGADVKGERVHIPRGLARKLCSTAPSSFTQHARNPLRNVEIGGRNLVLAPVYGPPFVRDADGGRRYGPGDCGRHPDAGSGRGFGGRVLFPTGARRSTGDCGGICDLDRHELWRADLWHT